MFTTVYYKEHIINNLHYALMSVTQITHLVHRRCVFSFTSNNTYMSVLKLFSQILQMTGINHVSFEHKSYDDKETSYSLELHYSHAKLFKRSCHKL